MKGPRPSRGICVLGAMSLLVACGGMELPAPSDDPAADGGLPADPDAPASDAAAPLEDSLPAADSAPAAGTSASAPLDFAYDFEPFKAKEYDTGWLPKNSSIQLRFKITLASIVKMRAPGEAVLSAQDDLSYRGANGAGEVEMDIGVQLEGKMRVSVGLPLGNAINWEGDLPMNPAFDYRFKDAATFTPFALEGSADRPVHLSDTLGEKKLLTIPIPGLGIPFVGSGAITVIASGKMSADFSGKDIRTTAGSETLVHDAQGQALNWSGGSSAEASYRGQLAMTGGIELKPAVAIQALGKSLVLARFPIKIGIANIGLPDKTITFETQQLSFAPEQTLQ